MINSVVFGNAAESQDPVVVPGPQSVATEDTFLSLLVAQLKNQNPLDPADGTEFVAQLAQFTQLEQTIGMKQDLDTIRQVLTEPAAADVASAEGNS